MQRSTRNSLWIASVQLPDFTIVARCGSEHGVVQEQYAIHHPRRIVMY